MPYSAVIIFQNKTDGNSTMINDISTTLDFAERKFNILDYAKILNE
jgi:hypothetical protein